MGSHRMKLTEGDDSKIEMVIDDGDLLNHQVFTSPTLEDAAWRRKVDEILRKRIKDTIDFNTLYKGKVKLRTIDPLWSRMVSRIADIERQIRQGGSVSDVGIYTWNPVMLSSDSDDEEDDEKTSTATDELNQAFRVADIADASDRESTVNGSDGSMPGLEGSEAAGSNTEAADENSVAEENVVDASSNENVAQNLNISGQSDEPQDRVVVLPTDKSIASESSFVTSEEDDHAIMTDIFKQMPANEIDEILTEAVAAAVQKAEDDKVVDASSRQGTAISSGFESGGMQSGGIEGGIETDRKRMASIHLHHIKGTMIHLTWKRPCLKGIEVVAFGDSTLRAFGRQGKELPGYCIVAYGIVI